MSLGRGLLLLLWAAAALGVAKAYRNNSRSHRNKSLLEGYPMSFGTGGFRAKHNGLSLGHLDNGDHVQPNAFGCSNRISRVGVEGEEIVLSPSVVANGNFTTIFWKKGDDIVANSWFVSPSGKAKQRLKLDSSGRLFLKNLSKEDTGHYTAEVVIDDEIKESCFDLKILVQPDINCTVNNDTIRLSCTSASEDLPLAYSWGYLRREDVIDVKDSVLQLQRSSDRFQKVTCNVTASDASASHSINLSDCVPGEEPDHQSSNTPLIVTVTIIIIIIIFGVLLFFIRKYLKKRRSKIVNISANNARGNDKEENSELPEEERKPLTTIELKGMEKREVHEETPGLES